MNTPDILYYSECVLSNKAKKTPRYNLNTYCGYYEPLENITTKGGLYFYLMQSRKANSSTPEMYLQAPKSLNLTGLYNYFQNGKLSGFCCGNPYDKPTYSKKNLSNPFYNYRNDCFLFILHFGDEMYKVDTSILPESFEMVVLRGGNLLKRAWLSQLKNGGFDEALKLLRADAKPYQI